MEGNWNDANTHVSCFRRFQWPEAEFKFSYIHCRNVMPEERNAYAYNTAMNAFTGHSQRMQWNEKKGERSAERRIFYIASMYWCEQLYEPIAQQYMLEPVIWNYNRVKHCIAQQSSEQHTSSPRQYIQFSIRLSLIEWSRINFIRLKLKKKTHTHTILFNFVPFRFYSE